VPPPARRVLIAGVANFWGVRLAERLAADPAVELVVGLDAEPPRERLDPRVVFVSGDLRSPGLGALVRAAAPDVVVHNALTQFPGAGRDARAIHDLNVVGTLQLLAACDDLATLHTLVVRGSASIYGSEPDAPQFFTEDMAGAFPKRTRFQRDVAELESYVDTFARRHPAVTCTTLRQQPVIGTKLDTPVTRLLRLPVIPTVLGFDPRMQFLHEDDSVDALAAAIHAPARGAVNVAGPGTISLVRMLRRLRRPSLPIPHPLYPRVARTLAGLRGVRVTEDMVRFLRFGRGVDLGRLERDIGFTPALSTEAAVERVARLGVAAPVPGEPLGAAA
jgi:UDP-glucose 4-epimerase